MAVNHRHAFLAGRSLPTTRNLSIYYCRRRIDPGGRGGRFQRVQPGKTMPPQKSIGGGCRDLTSCVVIMGFWAISMLAGPQALPALPYRN